MSREYYYLISSLPGLRLGDAPVLSTDEFLSRCREQLEPSVSAALEVVSLVPGWNPCCEAGRRWQSWETYIRNSMLRGRAERTGGVADRWTAESADVFPSDLRQLEDALGAPDPWQRRQAVDRLRWQRLEDLSTGHPFDIDALVIYRLKLLLAEGWAAHDPGRGRDLLGSLTDTGATAAEAVRASVDLPAES